MSKKIAFVCEYCNNVFFEYPNNRTGKHCFCSRKCHNGWAAHNTPELEPYTPQWHKNHIPVHCEACGTIRWKIRSYARKCKHHFCNARCHGVWMSRTRVGKNNPGYRRVFVNCAVCDKEIERRPCLTKRNDKHFCSRACYAAWQSDHMQGEGNYNYNRVKKPCDECGAEIAVIPFRLNNFEQHFCDKKCHAAWRAKHITGENHPNWTGGYKDYYGPSWEGQRNVARSRDHYRCRVCKVTEKKLGRELDVHHIVPFRTFGYIVGENDMDKEANQLANLISLCAACHKQVEYNQRTIQLNLL